MDQLDKDIAAFVGAILARRWVEQQLTGKSIPADSTLPTNPLQSTKQEKYASINGK